jgi:hypothetical protein
MQVGASSGHPPLSRRRPLRGRRPREGGPGAASRGSWGESRRADGARCGAPGSPSLPRLTPRSPGMTSVLEGPSREPHSTAISASCPPLWRGIHVLGDDGGWQDVDGRDKPGHDEWRGCAGETARGGDWHECRLGQRAPAASTTSPPARPKAEGRGPRGPSSRLCGEWEASGWSRLGLLDPLPSLG